jgi:hypothetical protein
MKGIFVIGSLIAMLIAAYLVMERINRPPQIPKEVLQDTGIEQPKNMQDMPSRVEDAVNIKVEQGLQRTEDAIKEMGY